MDASAAGSPDHILAEHHSRFLQFLRRRVESDAVAEDILQDAYARSPTLKPEYADIVGEVELGECSIAEVASEKGLTTNNATVRLHRARAALRRRLVLGRLAFLRARRPVGTEPQPEHVLDCWACLAALLAYVISCRF